MTTVTEPVEPIEPIEHGPIRTFKYRRGRVTLAQQQAIDTVGPVLGLDLTAGLIDSVGLFGREAPLVFEIGFGMGETTVAMAAAQPERDLIAVDVHTPGAGALLRALSAEGLTNVRVAVGDALEVLRGMVPYERLDEIRLFFPDPWPKTKHFKRRLFTADFAALAVSRLKPGGVVHVATDWGPYAEQVLDVVAAEPLLVNDFGGPAPRPESRPVTRFEQQGLGKGHIVYDIVVRRVG
ncbi:tRNA (guanosine(46)-N7)-methyltransferase TrmB [Acidothermaceae bacterium B102]|nr:tRNA (guanosine(46)-N7)-methyltransferase TrmB [Acidothermaceae bacterium B102]